MPANWATPVKDWTPTLVTENDMDVEVRDRMLYLYDQVGVRYRKVTEKDVVNTVTETDLLNGEITIAAGVMSTNRMLQASLLIDYLNNTGGNQDIALAIKLGGTTLWSDLTSMTTSASRRALWLNIKIMNLNSASVQFLSGFYSFSAEGGATTGLGDLNAQAPRQSAIASNGTVAVNTAVAQAFVVTATHGTANASLSCRLKSALVEVL